MRFTFTVEVEVNFTSGKFAARSDIADQIISELDNCNPGSLSTDNEGEYEVADWTVSEEAQPKPKRKPRAKKPPKAEAASAEPAP